MKVNEILTEAKRNLVILVDFQPAYDSDMYGYREALTNTVNALSKQKPSTILAFYNGEEVGIEDTAHEVLLHYIDYGLDESVTDNMDFREKSYAWLRNWMDVGVDDAVIIAVIRFMVMNRINDSRDLTEEQFIQILGEEKFEEYQDRIMSDDMIYIPDIAINELKSMSGCLLGGGGNHECLKEIQLLMNAFNIKYRLVNDWIYGR